MAAKREVERLAFLVIISARDFEIQNYRSSKKLRNYLAFEDFVKKLISEYGITIEEKFALNGPASPFDFKVTNSLGKTAAVIVKFYTSLRVSWTNLEPVFDELERAKEEGKYDYCIFITNSRIPPDLVNFVKNQVVIWGYDTLSFLAGRSSTLYEEWQKIKRESFVNRSEPSPIATEPGDTLFIDNSESSQAKSDDSHGRLRGTDLCTKLQQTKAGRSGNAANIFEDIATEILKYLFHEDLIHWSAQNITYDRLHRYDLIARISSDNDFWNSLINHHRARYVVFEFKNYGQKIKQSQVYTTEKYLFPQAMRSTAIIVSRKGADKNAIRVMHGAFRETGKLILSLDIDQICEMLRMRDKGLDPADLLSDLVDKMMMGIER